MDEREMKVTRGLEEYSLTFGFGSVDSFKEEILGKKVLDVGSGDGNLKKDLGNDGVNIVNLDIRRVPNSQSVQSKSEQMPFEDSTFDIIFCNHSLFLYGQKEEGVELADTIRQQAREVYRVLKPDGLLYVTLLPTDSSVTPNENSNFYLYTSLNTNQVTSGPTLKLLIDAGFDIEKVENFITIDSNVETTRVILKK